MAKKRADEPIEAANGEWTTALQISGVTTIWAADFSVCDPNSIGNTMKTGPLGSPRPDVFRRVEQLVGPTDRATRSVRSVRSDESD